MTMRGDLSASYSPIRTRPELPALHVSPKVSLPLSSPSHASQAPIEDHRQLTAYIAEGGRPKADWRIGTEHEKFGFRLDDLRPPTFEGERGIEALLKGLARYGWQEVQEHGHTIALLRDGASVTLEPAGQLELSGAPLENIHQTCVEVGTHLQEVHEVGDELGLGFLGMGFQPKWRRDDMPWMPKSRYRIMREYMPKVGQLGLDMMTRTCTVQVNLDFADEADMVKKFRVSLALQPVATALFADSPFTDGQPNGYVSYRSHIWTDTDADRTGMLDFVFEDGFGYERYVDYMLDVPMYFIQRGEGLIDASGLNFRDFLDGRLPVLPGELPTLRDWSDHLTTAFPEVRLKRFLEMRGADAGPWGRLCALPAFWVGLLYDQTALDAAWDLVKGFSLGERHALRDGVPRHGFKLPVTIHGRHCSVRELAIEALKISAAGLQRRAALNGDGIDESRFLEPLIEFAESGQTPADRKLALFNGVWQGDIDHVFSEFAY